VLAPNAQNPRKINSKHDKMMIETIKEFPSARGGISVLAARLALIVSLFCASIYICNAQSPDSTPAEIADAAPVALVTFVNGASLTIQSQGGDVVGVNAGEIVGIELHVSPVSAATAVVAQPLDGGKVVMTDQSQTVSSDGKASFGFQAGTKPGLYRVFARAGGTVFVIPFWISDPNGPDNPALIEPQN
jgi:hypothetical protein